MQRLDAQCIQFFPGVNADAAATTFRSIYSKAFVSIQRKVIRIMFSFKPRFRDANDVRIAAVDVNCELLDGIRASKTARVQYHK
jgi:hypothetical protein